MYKIAKLIYIKCRKFFSWIVNKKLPKYFCRNQFTAKLYYTFISQSFLREYYAVLSGKKKYLNDSENYQNSYYLLVRNTHRIEKGILMIPRRKIFAKGYIEETVNAYVNIIRNDSNLLVDDNQIKWADDVLNEYFTVVGDDEYISRQEDLYNKIRITHGNGISTDTKMIPYFRDCNNLEMSYDHLFNLSVHRRSVRWYSKKKVSRSLIDKALEIAALSPSACNRQPFEYRIFDDPKLVEKVINIPMGTKGYAHNVPVVAVVLGNLDAYFDERDRHLIYIDASLANMSFMYALETLGLSSCPINWPDIRKKEAKMKELLKYEDYQKPIMLISIGYADHKGKVAYSAKRSINKLRRYN